MARKTGKTGASRSQGDGPPGVGTVPPKTGYRNPPRHAQFRKGQSGNTKGRPKGSKNLGTVVMEAARDRVTATIDGKPRKVSKLQATAMQLATKAASGHPASVGQFLDWVDEIERRAAAAKPVEFPFSKASLALARGRARNRRAREALYFCRRANEMAPWNGAPIISTSYARARSSSLVRSRCRSLIRR